MPKTTRQRKDVAPHNGDSLLFEHVVVLMLEDRSFDRLVGYLGFAPSTSIHIQSSQTRCAPPTSGIQQARRFMRTKVTKHLEHYFASGANPKKGRGSKISAGNQLPSSTISPSRIADLKGKASRRTSKQPRP